MRIVYVGNFKRPWCTEVHVTEAFTDLGHQVVQVQEDGPGIAGAAEHVERHGADLVLWTRTWSTPLGPGLAALDRIRGAGVPSVSYHLDRWWGLDREYQLDTEPFFRTDLVITADGGHDDLWPTLGIRHLWLPPAVSHREARTPGNASARWGARPVVFVGSLPYPHRAWHPVRQAAVDAVQHAFPLAFRVWPQPNRPIRGQALADLYASVKVVVGDSCLIPDPDGTPVTRYWSDRIPETTGRGALLIHPQVEGLDQVHPFLPTYPLGDTDALVDAVREFLSDDDMRTRMAALNRDHTLEHHTYLQRAEAIVDLVPGLAMGTVDGATGVTTVRHRRTGAVASFDLRPGTDDGIVVREVWPEDVYQVEDGWLRGQTVVDLGANIGAFSILAARCGANGVHAYEPVPDTRTQLVANLARNGLDGQVTIFGEAVTGVGRQVRMVGPSSGAMHVDLSAPVDGLLVPSVMMATVIERAGHVGLLKMDMEGGEHEALAHLPRPLWDRIERIVMEFHGPGMVGGGTEADVYFLLGLLAEWGNVHVVGRPSIGGTIWGTKHPA